MATELALKTAEIASHDVGIREQGTNDGPRIKQYLATNGLSPPEPYCASACCCWVKEAGQALGQMPQILKSGSAIGLWNRNPHLRLTDITPEDIPCIGLNVHADGIHGHAFLIVGMDDDGRLQTIDPNSNEHGGREGTGVWALNVRSTKDADRLGYITIT